MIVSDSPESSLDVLMDEDKEVSGRKYENDVDESKQMMDDDDDPVIREIEVYVNRIRNPNVSAEETESSGASMFLLQYPLRPIYRPYGDQGRLVKIKYRKYQKLLQMHYVLNTESDNFDPQQRAELLENQLTGPSEKSGAIGGTVSHILNSMGCVSTNSSYGLGLLQENRLYVTPLTSVLQFRPDFSHVDEEESRARKRAENHLKPGTEASETSTPTTTSSKSKKEKKTSKEENVEVGTVISSTQQTTSTPSRPVIPPESEWHRYPPSRVRDFLLGEPWENVDLFYDPDSTETHEIVQLLTSFEVPVPKSSKENDDNLTMSSNEEEEEDRQKYKRVSGGSLVPKIQFSSEHLSYVNRLCSHEQNPEVTTSTDALSGSLSYLSLSRLPIDQQVLRILQHRHIESFSKIKSLLTKKISDEELVMHLRSYGEIILGNWVCKSALIYDGLVSHSRDLLLCLFSMEKPINREKVKPYVGNLSMEKLSQILKEVKHQIGSIDRFLRVI